MKIHRTILIEEIAGAWVVTLDDKSQSYSQHPATQDHIRLIKDLLKHLALNNTVDIKER